MRDEFMREIMEHKNISAKDFAIDMLGPPQYDSPLVKSKTRFFDDSNRVTFFSSVEDLQHYLASDEELPSFEMAGPRKKLFFDPTSINCGIVTCGGLCPGVNDVIRSIVFESYLRYSVQKVYGFRNGYKGIVKENHIPPVLFDTEMVDDIHEKGGTILSSSRGMQDTAKIVDYLQELKVFILFAIGGDGTLRGAAAIAEEIEKRGLNISVIGVPKTIDNDICFVEKTFGFETAVEASRAVIQSAHVEAKGTENGIGLVKLMGRDSGFIAAQATLANADVNFCLVPEVPFELEGENGFLPQLEKRLLRRKHAVIVVAEGAGQELIDQHGRGGRKRDASGNVLHEDIGVFLRNKIVDYFHQKQISTAVKYIDPSYIIRSKPANANDSLFCLQMGQSAVHAGMAGRTRMLIGYWNHYYTHVPLRLVTLERKKIDPEGVLWQTVLSVLG